MTQEIEREALPPLPEPTLADLIGRAQGWDGRFLTRDVPDLPPLPAHGPVIGHTYSADQMHAYARAALSMKAPAWPKLSKHDCGDPTCPGQDGDTCHYEGKNPWPRKASAEPVARVINGTEVDGNGDKTREREIDWYEGIVNKLPVGTLLYARPPAQPPVDEREALRAALELGRDAVEEVLNMHIMNYGGKDFRGRITNTRADLAKMKAALAALNQVESDSGKAG